MVPSVQRQAAALPMRARNMELQQIFDVLDRPRKTPLKSLDQLFPGKVN